MEQRDKLTEAHNYRKGSYKDDESGVLVMVDDTI